MRSRLLLISSNNDVTVRWFSLHQQSGLPQNGLSILWMRRIGGLSPSLKPIACIWPLSLRKIRSVIGQFPKTRRSQPDERINQRVPTYRRCRLQHMSQDNSDASLSNPWIYWKVTYFSKYQYLAVSYWIFYCGYFPCISYIELYNLGTYSHVKLIISEHSSPLSISISMEQPIGR